MKYIDKIPENIKSFLENPSGGWLSPSGEFIPCSFGSHEIVGSHLAVLSEGLDTKGDLIGWARLSYSTCDATCHIANIRGLTKAQIRTLEKDEEISSFLNDIRIVENHHLDRSSLNSAKRTLDENFQQKIRRKNETQLSI